MYLKSDFIQIWSLYSGFICWRMPFLIKVLCNWILKANNTSFFIRQGFSHPQISCQRKSVHDIFSQLVPVLLTATQEEPFNHRMCGDLHCWAEFTGLSPEISYLCKIKCVLHQAWDLDQPRSFVQYQSPCIYEHFPDLPLPPYSGRDGISTCLLTPDCLKPELCLLHIAYTLLALKWEF